MKKVSTVTRERDSYMYGTLLTIRITVLYLKWQVLVHILAVLYSTAVVTKLSILDKSRYVQFNSRYTSVCEYSIVVTEKPKLLYCTARRSSQIIQSWKHKKSVKWDKYSTYAD